MAANMIAEALMERTRKGELRWTETQKENFHGLVSPREYNDREIYEFSTIMGEALVKLIIEHKYVHVDANESFYYKVGLEIGDPPYMQEAAECNDGLMIKVDENFAIAETLIRLINPNSPALRCLPPVPALS